MRLGEGRSHITAYVLSVWTNQNTELYFYNTFSGIDTAASLFISGADTGFLDRGSLVLVFSGQGFSGQWLSEPRLSQPLAGCRDVSNAYSRAWG